MALLQTTPLQQILQSNALLASAIRLKYPFLKLLQANVLSPLDQLSIWNGPDNNIKHSIAGIHERISSYMHLFNCSNLLTFL